MKRTLSIFLLLLFSACIPREPKEVLSRVDKKIYYPQREGLSGLFCQVESPYIDEMFNRIEQSMPQSKVILDQIKIQVRFYWKNGMGARFVIIGIPKELPALQDSVARIFKGTEILVVPPTELEQFEGLSVSMKKNDDNLELIGVNPDPKAELKEYHLLINPWKYLPLERRFVGEGYVSYSKLFYKTRKGHRYLTRIETLQDLNQGADFKNLVELDYKEQNGFWLVSRMVYKTIVAETGKPVVGPVELIFTDCNTNGPMPVDIFTKGKIQFMEPAQTSGANASPP